jgi:beta-glucosidase
LSYTTFKIGNAWLSKTTIKADETIQLTVPVTNYGKRDGIEVVQVYVHKVNDIEGPLKTLRGFKRVEIPAAKTRQVSIDLNPSSFEFFDWSQRKMMVTPGEYEVYYGNSSDSKNLKLVKVTIY